MTLLRNLIHAEAAVTFAESRLRGKASNRPEDIVHTLQQNLREDYDGDAEHVLLDLGSKITIGMKSIEIYQKRWTAIKDKREQRNAVGQRLDAAAIIQGGIGNCFEHSVLACHYLNGIGVPSYMVTTDENTNHVFVVIGVQGGLDGETVEAPPNQNPGAPLAAAFSVVCDPWYHEWFGIQADWSRKMKRILLTTNKRTNGQLPDMVPFTFTAGTHIT
jgi:hypothetical protein